MTPQGNPTHAAVPTPVAPDLQCMSTTVPGACKRFLHTVANNPARQDPASNSASLNDDAVPSADGNASNNAAINQYWRHGRWLPVCPSILPLTSHLPHPFCGTGILASSGGSRLDQQTTSRWKTNNTCYEKQQQRRGLRRFWPSGAPLVAGSLNASENRRLTALMATFPESAAPPHSTQRLPFAMLLPL